jgi:hypothetical protein
MPAPHPIPEPTHVLGLPITATEQQLSDGSTLVVTTAVPGTTGQRLRAVSLATFYGFFGRLLAPTGPVAGYFGETGALKDRPAVSFGRWTKTLGKILPAAMVLVLPPGTQTASAGRVPDPITRRRHSQSRWRKLAEGRVIRDLNMSVAMLNTQSAPIEPNRRLPRADRMAALTLADEISDAITRHVLGDVKNAHPFFARTNKEQAIRVIRNSPRPLDSFDVVRLTTAAGNPVPGLSPDFTLRRDLNDREQSAGGTPRIYTCLVTTPTGAVRRIFYGPHLSKRQALDRY